MHHHQPPSSAAAAIPSLCVVLCTTLFSILLILSLTTAPTRPRPPSQPHPSLFPNRHRLLFHDNRTAAADPLLPPPPPTLAYLISGSANDSARVVRLLHSVYHPRNQYLLHLDRSASQTDRDALAVTVQSVPLFRAAQNVHVVGKADYVFSNGPSALSSTLHGASVLLRLSSNWDWFINLAAADYPLVTQDDLLHILSYLPRNLNFVNHTSYIGWRESRKLKPIIVDPALYLTDNSEMFFATQKRPLPDAYRLFSGSPMALLSRKFIEFCILGTDNLPRTLLMYLSNTPASTSVYFPTVLCNSHQFNRTTINHSLHYSALDSRLQALMLNSSNFEELIQSGAAFASAFPCNSPVLDRIDRELLQRHPNQPVPGGWCLGDSDEDKCSIWGDADVLKPGSGAKRLEKRLVQLLSNGPTQCLND
ncbi:Core-2/I-branching beta-1 [Perilla frutescens var. hirtella]|nr:Core-2/I-branching beta-1 [Perilla frutescens var. hirtella]